MDIARVWWGEGSSGFGGRRGRGGGLFRVWWEEGRGGLFRNYELSCWPWEKNLLLCSIGLTLVQKYGY